MTPAPRLDNRPLVGTLMALLLLGALGLAPRAQAAAPSAPAAASSAEPDSSAYTVRRGDTLERIAQQHYPDSPLQLSAIVRELRSLNAATLGETAPRKRLKAGLSLQLPRHDRLVKRVLAPYVVQDEAERAQALLEQERRRWVRYP